MFAVSCNTPAVFITAITKDRLAVFRRSDFKDLFCRALAEAQKAARFLIFAYVVMPDHHPDVRLIYTEQAFRSRLQYIHANPVRAGLVEQADRYRWSSVRYWKGRPLEKEPITVACDQVRWHKWR